MKAAAFSFLLAIAGLAGGEGLPARDIIVLGSPESLRPAEAAHSAVVAGGTATFDLLIPAAVDREKLWIDLRLVAGGVTLPLGETQAFAGSPGEKPPAGYDLASVSVAIPKLERKSQVIARFFLKQPSPEVLAITRVAVFPPRDWALLSRRLRQDGVRLLVFGRDATLRGFFQARDIAFSDEGDHPPGRLDEGALAVGALAAREWDERRDRLAFERGRLLVFVGDADEPPGVYATMIAAGAVTKVTLPVLARLDRDPRGEELLFQLIEQHLSPAPGAVP